MRYDDDFREPVPHNTDVLGAWVLYLIVVGVLVAQAMLRVFW